VTSATRPEALFLPDGDGFKATNASLGPWGPDMLHGGAVSALLVQLLEEQGGPGWVPSRFTVDLVRPVTTGHLDVEGRIVRQGKRIQLLEAEILSDGKLSARCTYLRMSEVPVDLPDGAPVEGVAPPPDSPASFYEAPLFEPDKVFFVRTGIEMRVPDPGRFGGGVAWYRLLLPVLPGRDAPPMASVVAAGDFGNGLSGFRDRAFPQGVTFLNADLDVHVFRPPEGEWVRLKAISAWNPNGTGLALGELADEHGPIGVSQQSLVLTQI
jgi:hypothetical protein